MPEPLYHCIMDGKEFDALVRSRRSMRIYDQEQPFDGLAVQRSLERAVLAPNSSNMQLWEFYRVRDKEKLRVVAKYCMGQKAATTAREMVLVVVRRNLWKKHSRFMLQHYEQYYKEHPEQSHRLNRFKKYYGRMMPMYYFQDWFGLWGRVRQLIVLFASFSRPVVWQVRKQDLRVVCHKSAALAAQTFMLSMQAEGYSTCPMEGFDSKKAKRYLNLPKGSEINMIISCGPPTKEGIYNERIRVPNESVIREL